MSLTELSDDERLIELAAECRHDPLDFVMLAFPWGETGTPLERHPGPDAWQREVLEYVRDNIGSGKPLRIAIAGGVGPGKSALMAWLVCWAMVTCPDTRCRITANTGPQISTATWPEITKWLRMSLWASWFDVGERRIRSVEVGHGDSWRCDAITWDPHRPEAFAGFHNAGRRILYGFDESAAIADSIYRESEGILSGSEDTEIIWLCLGNPTRTNSHFRTLFAGGKNAHLWKSWHIDTRKARMSDKAQIQEWIESYGLDSDFVRVRVLSEFPRAGSTQFIAADVVERAMDPRTECPVGLSEPLVMGVDVARYGDDVTVIRLRRGRDARTLPVIRLRGASTMQVAARIAEVYNNPMSRPDAIFVDEGGLGAGVVDRCLALKLPVIGVNFGARPDGDMATREGGVRCYNKAAEMWTRMRDWLASGAMLNDDPELKEQLVSREYGYGFVGGNEAVQLERKDDLKKRGLASCDDADALALTFAHAVAPVDQSWKFGRFASGTHQSGERGYDPIWGSGDRAGPELDNDMMTSNRHDILRYKQ